MSQKKKTSPESAKLPLIHITFASLQLTPEFQHLKDAPLGEFEACNTLAPEPRTKAPSKGKQSKKSRKKT
jgi:hypothetical protein